jgi:hypothetical protein
MHNGLTILLWRCLILVQFSNNATYHLGKKMNAARGLLKRIM